MEKCTNCKCSAQVFFTNWSYTYKQQPIKKHNIVQSFSHSFSEPSNPTRKITILTSYRWVLLICILDENESFIMFPTAFDSTLFMRFIFTVAVAVLWLSPCCVFSCTKVPGFIYSTVEHLRSFNLGLLEIFFFFVNILVYLFCWTYGHISLRSTPKMELLVHLSSLGNAKLFSRAVVPVSNPTSSEWEFQLLRIHVNTLYFLLFV